MGRAASDLHRIEHVRAAELSAWTTFTLSEPRMRAFRDYSRSRRGCFTELALRVPARRVSGHCNRTQRYELDTLQNINRRHATLRAGLLKVLTARGLLKDTLVI